MISKQTGGLRSPRRPKDFPKFLGRGAFGKLLYEYVEHAYRCGIPFDLSYEQVYNLTKGNCYYCGVSPIQERHAACGQPYLFNGIDRLDNSKGYNIENCVSCCSRCNYGKSSLPVKEFLHWIKSVYEYKQLKNADF